jgi:hypothetical protein
MGHTCGVGRLLLGHTVRQEEGGWGRQVIIRTASELMRQPVAAGRSVMTQTQKRADATAT